jgi:hypothetical protein
MANPFTDHPRAVGETYGGHFAQAARFGGQLLAAGIACWAHALVPALCERTGSRAVGRLHAAMSARAAVAVTPAEDLAPCVRPTPPLAPEPAQNASIHGSADPDAAAPGAFTFDVVLRGRPDALVRSLGLLAVVHAQIESLHSERCGGLLKAQVAVSGITSQQARTVAARLAQSPQVIGAGVREAASGRAAA